MSMFYKQKNHCYFAVELWQLLDHKYWKQKQFLVRLQLCTIVQIELPSRKP